MKQIIMCIYYIYIYIYINTSICVYIDPSSLPLGVDRHCASDWASVGGCGHSLFETASLKESGPSFVDPVAEDQDRPGC